MPELTYPDAPGWKAQPTSQQAALDVAPAAKTLRERVLASIQMRAATPEMLAARLGAPVMNIRPRCSELLRKGLIRDSGQRGPAIGGRRAIIWEAVDAAA